MSEHTRRRKHHKHTHKHTHKHVHKKDWRELFSRYFIGICVVAGALVLGLGSFIAWGLYQSHLYQGVYGPELEAEFGFTTESPSLQAGGRKVEVSVIHPKAGGYMDKIGFLDGEIITSHTITELYRMLDQMRGETVAVDVVDGGNGVPIEERKVKTRRFLIPPKP